MRKIISILTALAFAFALVVTASGPASAASPAAPTCNSFLARFSSSEMAKCKARDLWFQLNTDAANVAKDRNGANRAEIVAKNYLMVSAPLAKTDQNRWTSAFEANFNSAKSKASSSASSANRIILALRDTVANNQKNLNQIEATTATLKAMSKLGTSFSKINTKTFIKNVGIPFMQDQNAKNSALVFFIYTVNATY